MTAYVLDANAVLRYFKAGSSACQETMQELFLKAQRSQAELSMSAVNLGEVFYVLIKYVGEQRARHYVDVLQHAVVVVEAGSDRAMEAAALKYRHNLGYADSFAAALALEKKATLVSADPCFEAIGKPLKWLKLPRHR